jgi:ABC-2 type transport system ATP-binding protein
MATNAIQVIDIVKRFGNFTAVDGVSFAVEEGEIFGLLGPNGAGKSTLIRMMTTLLDITSGTAIIEGADVRKNPNTARRSMGVIPQAMTSDGDLTVWENLSIYSKLYGIPAADRDKSIDELLLLVDLNQWRDAPARNLSGGMRRRLEIARGLVHRPRIFFLDEPTTGLDPVSRVAVWEMITSIKQQRNLTVLITTHYMDEADRLCDRIAIVDHGKLVALDTPRNLKNSIPGSSVIEAQFLQPPANWQRTLEGLVGVKSVQPEGADMYRILTEDGSRTTTALVETAVHSNVVVKTLTVQSTTLDDVFVHFTGRQLRDQIVDSPLYQSPVAWGKKHAQLFQERTHDGHRGTRSAQIFSLTRPDGGRHGLPACPADRFRECLWRQNQGRQDRNCFARYWPASHSRDGSSARSPKQRAYFPADHLS